MDRTKTDEELQAIADTFNDSERHGAHFALFPASKMPEDMSTADTVKLMELIGVKR